MAPPASLSLARSEQSNKDGIIILQRISESRDERVRSGTHSYCAMFSFVKQVLLRGVRVKGREEENGTEDDNFELEIF